MFFWLFNLTYRGVPILLFWAIAIIGTLAVILMNLGKFRKVSLIIGLFIGALAYVGLIFLLALSALP
ncbi:MAG: hypothetical protein ACPLY9_02025 [Nitrososphaerales archaeon]